MATAITGKLRALRRLEWIARLDSVPDAMAIVVLLLGTVYLVGNDGGRQPRDMLWVLVTAGMATPLLIPVLRRTTYAVTLLIAGWALGFLLALATAEIRAGALRPLTAAALAPAAALATIHVWRRPWGPAVLGGILAAAAVRSWYLTFLAWWGGSMGRPVWLALSWHNQSGTLMGALGVAAAATAAVIHAEATPLKRSWHMIRLVAVIIAGAALAGSWLSGSRGALVATGLGLVTIVVALARGRSLVAAVPALAGVVLATALVGGGLEGMVRSDAGQPLATRDHTAAHNLAERFGYWQAAVGMISSRPMTGWGPGSYRWASRPFYPEDISLTSSAHNEYAEALAEGGLIGGLPVWFAALAAATLAAGVALRGPGGAGPLGRQAGELAAAGAVVVLGSHAAIDFDWDYPLLLALFAIAASVLWAESSQAAKPSTERHRMKLAPALLASAVTFVLLGTAVAGSALAQQGNAPWDLTRTVSATVEAVRAGEVSTAREHLDRLRTWNPGLPSLPILTAVTDHAASEISDSVLLAAIDPETASFADQLLVARRLYDSGNAAAARAIVESLAPRLGKRRRWGVESSAVEVAILTLATEAALKDCGAAAALTEPLRRWVKEFNVAPEAQAKLLVAANELSGCFPGQVDD